MALYGLYCAEVPLRNCSLTHSLTPIPLPSTPLTAVVGRLQGHEENMDTPIFKTWLRPSCNLLHYHYMYSLDDVCAQMNVS